MKGLFVTCPKLRVEICWGGRHKIRVFLCEIAKNERKITTALFDPA